MIRSLHLRRLPAFTLVELLLVVGIMILMIGLIAPAASQMLRGSYISQSGDMVGDQLALARQAAMSSNRRVQVRFYDLPRTTVTGSNVYYGVQSFRMEESGVATALTKLQTLNTNVIFLADVAHSPIIAAPAPTVSGTVQLPAYGNKLCGYVGFQFLPDGSTDLSSTPPSGANGWFVTLVDGSRKVPANGVPVNFYTLRVEPLNGHTRVFRP